MGVHMSLPDRFFVSNENEGWFFIPARTGKIITPNGIGPLITEGPSHPTERTDRVLGE